MSETPETDANAIEVGWGHMMVDADFAKKLERERDEAREIASGLAEQAERLRKERNEARNRLADALQELDLRTLDFERVKAERDDLRERYESALKERDSWMVLVEEKRAMRRELEELLGIDNGAPGDEQFKKGLKALKAVIKKAKL